MNEIGLIPILFFYRGNNMDEIMSKEFYENIKKLLSESRKSVTSYVNKTLLFTYWNIGKMIVKEQGD